MPKTVRTLSLLPGAELRGAAPGLRPNQAALLPMQTRIQVLRCLLLLCLGRSDDELLIKLGVPYSDSASLPMVGTP
jgi:hypothetical protein